jgi:hypothetical protein
VELLGPSIIGFHAGSAAKEVFRATNPRTGERLQPGVVSVTPEEVNTAYRPKASDTDADRNLISNIHLRGVSTEQAAVRILNLAAAMMRTNTSGCQLREELPGISASNPRLPRRTTGH